MYSCGPPHMAEQKHNDQLEYSYSSYVRIRDIALKTCQSRWTIGRSGKRGSGISVLAARHDDNDDDDIYFKMIRSTKRFVFFRIYLFILFLHICMFPARCVRQRTCMAQSLVNWVFEETWTVVWMVSVGYGFLWRALLSFSFS